MLDGLLDPANDRVWAEFDARYRPVVEALAGRCGLSDADASDVAQETLTLFCRDYRARKYDRERGRLGAWIAGIARNRIAEAHRRRERERGWRGDSALGSLPSEQQLSLVWDEECRQEVLRTALRALRETTRVDAATIRAFELLALQERTPADVARELGVTIDVVYAAKSRCMGHLRSILADLRRTYELS